LGNLGLIGKLQSITEIDWPPYDRYSSECSFDQFRSSVLIHFTSNSKIRMAMSWRLFESRNFVSTVRVERSTMKSQRENKVILIFFILKIDTAHSISQF
jgi:hypothetical protein